MAFDLEIFEKCRGERVANRSLFRFVDSSRISMKLHRLSRGDVALSKYDFSYIFPDHDTLAATSTTLDFIVEPESSPPSNVHVLIGRNGVGKTTCMNNMTRAFLRPTELSFGSFKIDSYIGDNFSNLISVTFSAFDEFFNDDSSASGRYAYIGLKKKAGQAPSGHGQPYTLKSPPDLEEEFVETAARCRLGLKLDRWKRSLETLSSDPLFAESDVQSLCDEYFDEEDWRKEAVDIFHGLSSGHKIVLLTISRLVELVQEQSLVLIDEPEGHLHPPLLSAFIRSLSELLTSQNGVAIIATHSPVVLQEVPKSCVWIMNRSGRTIVAARPKIETFAENVGILTHEVFGLEVRDTGFHKLIKTALVGQDMTYEQALALFSNQIGSEGLAVASSIAYLKDGHSQ